MQAGTEHVTNIISGIAGAVASAPAAALEAISPVAASKVSDAASAISARLPALSLEDAQATATGLANKAYSAIPEGTAATIQGYAGAAVGKAQEVLPPALGGTTVSRIPSSTHLTKPLFPHSVLSLREDKKLKLLLILCLFVCRPPETLELAN